MSQKWRLVSVEPHYRKIKDPPPLLRMTDDQSVAPKPKKSGFFQNKRSACNASKIDNCNEGKVRSNECESNKSKGTDDYIDFHAYPSNNALKKMKWSTMDQLNRGNKVYRCSHDGCDKIYSRKEHLVRHIR